MLPSLYEQSKSGGPFFTIQAGGGTTTPNDLIFIHTSFEGGAITSFLSSSPANSASMNDIQVTSMELVYTGSDRILELFYTSQDSAFSLSFGSYGFGATSGSLGYVSDATQDNEEVQLIMGAFSDHAFVPGEFSFDNLSLSGTVPEPSQYSFLLSGFVLTWVFFFRSRVRSRNLSLLTSEPFTKSVL